MTYCYSCECEHKLERTVPLSEFAENIECPECGGQMHIDPTAQHGRTLDTPSCWPMESDAAGVHPDQAKELSEHCRAHGVPTEINPHTGNPVFTGRGHRKRFCQVTNIYDRNAGIGDATPKHDMQKRKGRKRYA